jgi:chaperonin GroES
MATKAKKAKAKKAAPKKATKAVSRAPQAKAERAGLMPLGDRIVVRPLDESEMGTKSPSGIIIPDTVSKEKPAQGIVVAVGPGRVGDDNKRVPMSVEAGDRILFSKYGFDEVKVGGKEYFIVSEQSVLAVIND